VDSCVKKSLKISKRLSESVKQRTDNTMGKRKRTNNDLQSITHKTKDQVTQTLINMRMLIDQLIVV
jgi:hypothetical protein